MFRDDRSRELAMFVERYVLPLVFIGFGARNLHYLYVNLDSFIRSLGSGALGNVPRFVQAMDDVRFLALIVFNFLVAYALLISRSTKVGPEGMREVLVPLAATFWYVVVNLVDYLPQEWNVSLLPPSWILAANATGAALALAGVIFSLWGVVTLRKSFGVMVRVNDVVTNGLYRYMRHPIYFSYLLSFTGLVLLRPVTYEAIVYGMAIPITLYRAKLEERKLATHSAEYREYMRAVPYMPWQRQHKRS